MCKNKQIEHFQWLNQDGKCSKVHPEFEETLCAGNPVHWTGF